MTKIKFIKKTIYLEHEKILVIGDLHLGFDLMLLKKGITFPINQTKNNLNEIEEIINKTGKQKIKKIIFLGDILHNFKFDEKILSEEKKFFEGLKKIAPKSKIIKIKGNHDKTNNPEYIDYHIHKDIFFAHGDKPFPEMLNGKIKTIIISHIHPAVVISDRIKVKKEKFKVFLKGKWKNKNIVILPSFFQIREGMEINENYEKKQNWAVLSEKNLKNFSVYVIGKDKIYKFGKYKELI